MARTKKVITIEDLRKSVAEGSFLKVGRTTIDLFSLSVVVGVHDRLKEENKVGLMELFNENPKSTVIKCYGLIK